MARKRARPHPHCEAKKPSKATELERFTNEVVSFVNTALEEAEAQHDVIANFLFENVCDSDPTVALDPARALSPKVQALQAQAGQSLALDKTALSRHLRVGALNELVSDDEWHALGWYQKVALLPLVKDPETDLPALRNALETVANEPMGVRALQAWVASERALPRPVARKGISVSASKRLISTGALLGDKKVLLSLAQRLNKLEPDARGELIEELDRAIEALPQLRLLLEGE